jgi:N-acetylglucosaminyldiphosphoundecaprenol N-acetyl-beta-D-mannosaminyltransferase
VVATARPPFLVEIERGSALPVRPRGESARSLDQAFASRRILGMRVDATTCDEASLRIMDWAQAGEARYVCVASVNNAIQADGDPDFLGAMNGADLVTADGMPLVWGLRMLGLREAVRVCGPDLTPALLDLASRQGIQVGFYGGTPETLGQLLENVRSTYPKLPITYAWSPPFRTLTGEEQQDVFHAIRRSGARLLLVGLGAPKQERFIAELRTKVSIVAVGVGAVFDLLAGRTKRAPRWMQGMGLEWVFRLATEPRRLWRRYAVGNPKFVVRFGAQVLRARVMSRPSVGPGPSMSDLSEQGEMT